MNLTICLSRIKNKPNKKENNMATPKKGTPKRDGSGKGTGNNAGRGGCTPPKKPNQPKK